MPRKKGRRGTLDLGKSKKPRWGEGRSNQAKQNVSRQQLHTCTPAHLPRVHYGVSTPSPSHPHPTFPIDRHLDDQPSLITTRPTSAYQPTYLPCFTYHIRGEISTKDTFDGTPNPNRICNETNETNETIRSKSGGGPFCVCSLLLEGLG
jgi:hypothetical protein